MFAELGVWDFAAIAAKLFSYCGSFIAAGSVIFLLANPNLHSQLRQRVKAKLPWVIAIAIIASLAQATVQSGRLLDEGFGGMVDAEMLELVKDSPLGTSLFVRVSSLLLLLAFVFTVPMANAFGAVGALLIALSFSLVGHGAGEPWWLMGPLVTIHVLAVSFWIGALWPLMTTAKGGLPLKEAGALAHRFGNQAAIVVSLLILAGVILTYQLVGSVEGMFTSQYGLTLVFKLVVVAALLSLALANKWRFVPAMMNGDPKGAEHLIRSIKWEAIAVAVILFVTAVLTTVTSLPEAPAQSMEMQGDS